MNTQNDSELSASANEAVTEANAGYGLFESSDFAGALARFQKALELWPDNQVFCYDVARTLREIGDYEGALKSIDRAIELDQAEPQFHHAKGNIKRSLKDLEGAVREFKRALELDKEFPAHNNLGLTYHELGKMKLARDVLEKGLNLAPEDTDLWQNLAAVTFNMKRFAIAALCDEQVTKLRPELTSAWACLANDYFELGWLDKAEFTMRRAIRRGEDSAENYNDLARILLAAGKQADAARAFERAHRSQQTGQY